MPKRKLPQQDGKPLVEVLHEATAPIGSLLETARLIQDVVQDLRLGLDDDSDNGDRTIEEATDRLESYGRTLRQMSNG